MPMPDADLVCLMLKSGGVPLLRRVPEDDERVTLRDQCRYYERRDDERASRPGCCHVITMFVAADERDERRC